MTKRFAIVGNGVAGVTAALTIRERDPKAEITMIGGESDYFFSRTALMYAFMDRMNLRDLEPYERKTYRDQRIGLRRAWVKDLDGDARRLTLDTGETVPYDQLLLATGSVPRKPAWHRPLNGVVNFVSLQDLAECEKWAPSTRKAIVVGGGLIGVELVECLHHHGVQVTFLVREPWYWPAALFEEEGEMISGHILEHGIELIHKEEVASLIEDNGRVRGVKCTSGREFDCGMAGICIGVEPAADWLRGVRTPPSLGRGIRVDESFRTSIPGVWAAGDCAELPTGQVEQIWYSAKRQGALAARAMLGETVLYRPPLFFNSAKLFEIDYTTVGRLKAASRTHYERGRGKYQSIRITEHDGRVSGFNMLGSRWDHTRLERWIHEGRTLDDVLPRLNEARFDVEFAQ